MLRSEKTCTPLEGLEEFVFEKFLTCAPNH
jgi:hypothetical protein